MTARGEVRAWYAAEGWAVIDSEANPGGCCPHVSAVLVDRYRRFGPVRDVDVVFGWSTAHSALTLAVDSEEAGGS